MTTEFLAELLWSATWQSWVLTILVYAITKCAPKTSPHFHGALWSMVLLRLAIPPLFVLPTSAGAWGSRLYESVTGLFVFPVSQPVSEISMTVTRTLVPETTVPAIPIQEVTQAPNYAGVIVSVWVVGLLACLIVGLLSQRISWKRVRESSTPDESLATVFEACRRQLGLRRKVLLKVEQGSGVPMVCGIFRPVVVLPSELASSLEPEALRSVFCHELMHVRRGDVARNAVEWMVCVLHFFNPAAWLAWRQISRAREQACDDAVILAGADSPHSYAQSLLRISDLLPENRAWSGAWVAMAERKSDAGVRLKRILDPKAPRHQRLSPVGWIASILMVALVFTLHQPSINAAEEPIGENAPQLAPEQTNIPELVEVETIPEEPAEPALKTETAEEQVDQQTDEKALTVYSFQIAPPGGVNRTTEKAFLANVVKVLETILYSDGGKRKAISEGRRLWVDEAKMQVVVTDYQENIDKVQEYLEALGTPAVREPSKIYFLDHTDSLEAVMILRREVPQLEIEPIENLNAVYMRGAQKDIDEAVSLMEGFDVKIDIPDEDLEAKTAVINLSHVDATSVYNELLADPDSEVEVSLFSQRNAIVLSGDPGAVDRTVAYIRSIDQPADQYLVKWLLITPGLGKKGHDAEQIQRDLAGRDLSSVEFLDSWEKLGWIQKIASPKLMILEGEEAMLTIQSQLSDPPASESGQILFRSLNYSIRVMKIESNGEEFMNFEMRCFVTDDRDGENEMMTTEMILEMDDSSWKVVPLPVDRSSSPSSVFDSTSHVFIQVAPVKN